MIFFPPGLEFVSYIIWGTGWANAAPMFFWRWWQHGTELHGSRRRFVLVSILSQITFKWFWEGAFNVCLYDRPAIWGRIYHWPIMMCAADRLAYSDSDPQRITGLYGNIAVNAAVSAFTAFFWVGLNQEWINEIYDVYGFEVSTRAVATLTGTLSGWSAFGHIDHTFGYRRYAFYLRCAAVAVLLIPYIGYAP